MLLLVLHDGDRELLPVAGTRHPSCEYAPVVLRLAVAIELDDGLAGVGTVGRVGRLDLTARVGVPNNEAESMRVLC